MFPQLAVREVENGARNVRWPEADDELGRIAGTCAALLHVADVLLLELSGATIRRYGRFGAQQAASASIPPFPVTDFGALAQNVFGSRAAFVQPVTDDAGEVVGMLLAAEASLAGRLPAGVADAVALLLASAFEARRLRRNRKRLELSVQRSEHWLRQVAETVPNGVALVDRTGTVMELNSVAGTIFGEDRLAIIGRDLRELLHADDRATLAEELDRRAAGDRKRRETELRLVRRSGELRIIRVRFSTLMNGELVAGICMSVQDVTDERAREAQLRRVERFADIAPLLAGVCHELNNPLTSIRSFAELLLLDERPEDDREALEIVRREAARAARIVSDLRLVARKTKADGATLVPIDLNDLVRQQCEQLRDEFRRGDIDVRVDLTRSSTRLNGVRPHLERVIAELLTNAGEAVRLTDHPRRISIRTYATEAGVALRVSDSGPGIHPEDIDRIFDPFWTSRPVREGTGLGLSLVHGIVTDHNGHIRVEPGLGSGATFTIDFPTASDVLSLQREPPVQASARTALRVLIVDDEAPIRFALGRYLSRRGHEISEAEEGGTAMELIERCEAAAFDVIVADLRMPGLGGDELYAWLKAGGRGLEERLIFITGDAESPDVRAFLEDAGVPVILKPFELPEIAMVIESQGRALPPLSCDIAA